MCLKADFVQTHRVVLVRVEKHVLAKRDLDTREEGEWACSPKKDQREKGFVDGSNESTVMGEKTGKRMSS